METKENLRKFREERERMNERVLGTGNLSSKRFFARDAQTYEGSALDTRTKELLGLVASIVLCCDDCVTYRLARCAEEGATEPRPPWHPPTPWTHPG